MEVLIRANGPCGEAQPPSERICTPVPHIHVFQTETFTVLNGNMGYYLSSLTQPNYCNSSCSPLVVQPQIPHTFWMSGEENLLVRVRLEPADREGSREQFFENLVGLYRDASAKNKTPPLLALLVLLNHAEIYPATLPLSIGKLILKLGALLGRILGHQTSYEEYTTATV
ncbi:unnamed protein product [Didymodactylos carnosus]|uniref:Uncharacterized protein n=1 Tax=Didymodactylos carnosus TaxID=1234261 RepID=A0A8S2FZT3_9BILA|nr:unnamed protein product [Didymodactylos carnosus]CAF4401556.1 unnamed protein product [Didymodactylos carnosus]